MLYPALATPSRLTAFKQLRIASLGMFVAIALPFLTTAAVPTNPTAREAVIGKPASIVAEPTRIELVGTNASKQVIITGRYSDGSLRDLTPFAQIDVLPPELAVVEAGLFQPRKPGTGIVAISAGGSQLKIPIVVRDLDKPIPVSFRHDVIAALNVGGCNQGACHGTPSGKNGFRLSLRGFDPATDYLQLTRDVYGRRTDLLNPSASLILQKGLGQIAHEGGSRFSPDSLPARALVNWLHEGLRDDPKELPQLVKLDIRPGSRVLTAPSRWQQLAVVACFSNGTERDVTRLTVFSSSDTAVADVNANGLIEFRQSGESAILCRYLDVLQAVRITYLEPKKGFAWKDPPVANYIDQHVFAKLKVLSIAPSELCSDSEFLRRVYLDLCGITPTADEARNFLKDTDANKRAKVIDGLLERPEFADFWTLKWSDVFRANRKTIQAKGVHAFHQWLRDHVAKNSPLDAVVREMLTASGSSYINPPANYYRVARDPQSLAETTAQLFFGVRMQCAKCHNHPFEKWTQDDYYSTAAFFARVKQKKDPNYPAAKPNDPTAEIIFAERAGEVTQPRTGRVMPPRFLGGVVPPIPPDKDRREVFAEWLTGPSNPFFAKSVVNRIWYHLHGKGIVDPVDDFRESNPSANDELLDALAADFVKSGFDAKKLIRTIANSRTYQLSADPNDSNRDDNRYFSHATMKMLTAEQLLDALCDATGIPEKYAGLPAGTRAIQLPDGEVQHPFLKTFGQPARELACECERETDSNLAQALQLINGATINDKLRNPNNRIGRLLAAKKPSAEILDELYFATVARGSNPAESKAALAHVQKAGADPRRAWEDVLWALLNTRDFLFRH